MPQQHQCHLTKWGRREYAQLVCQLEKDPTYGNGRPHKVMTKSFFQEEPARNSLVAKTNSNITYITQPYSPPLCIYTMVYYKTVCIYIHTMEYYKAVCIMVYYKTVCVYIYIHNGVL